LLTRDERDANLVLDPHNYASPMAYLFEAMTLEGRHFELDNLRLYCKLKSFTVNGEGWSNIKEDKRSQDGRKAYLMLKTHCRGTASKITRKTVHVLQLQMLFTMVPGARVNFRTVLKPTRQLTTIFFNATRLKLSQNRRRYPTSLKA
jgi:hypothetical protein